MFRIINIKLNIDNTFVFCILGPYYLQFSSSVSTLWHLSSSFPSVRKRQKLFYRRFLKKTNLSHPPYIIISSLKIRDGEPADFLAVPAPDFFVQAAPAPHFFPKRLRHRLQLLVFFSSGFSSWLLVKVGKIFFSPQTSKVKLHKI